MRAKLLSIPLSGEVGLTITAHCRLHVFDFWVILGRPGFSNPVIPMRKLFVILAVCLPGVAMAAEYWEKIAIKDGLVDLFVMQPKESTITAVLLPGGPWALGKLDPVTKRPLGRNFLVRSAPLFYERGITTVVMGKPSNAPDLNDGVARTSDEHADAVLDVVEFVRQKFGHPVWLIGTSRGTQSAIAAALRDKRKSIAGLVLSASMLGTKYNDVSILDLGLKDIRLPVYISHHKKDECFNTSPRDVPSLAKALNNAPILAVKFIDSGHSPSERPCGPVHWHGYINAEEETVDGIASWIKNPN